MAADAVVRIAARRKSWMLRARGAWPAVFPAVGFLAALFVVPLAWFLAQSFTGAHGITLDAYGKLFATPVYFRVLSTTFEIAALTTIVSVAVGYPLAYFIARAPAARRGRLLVWVLLPFWTSFLVRTFVWLVLLGTHGPVAGFLHALGLTRQPQLLYNLTGVVIGMVHALMPFAVLTMVGAMENIDANLAKAAQTLGASPFQAFWRIYFPLSVPGVAAAGLLVFLTALGFFITPTLLGGAHQTVIAELIYQDVNQLLDWRAAGALSVVLMLATLAVFFAYGRLFGTGSLFGGLAAERGEVLGSGRDRGVRVSGAMQSAVNALLDRLLAVEQALSGAVDRVRGSRGSLREPKAVALGAWALVVLGFLVVPILLVVPMSLNGGSELALPPSSFSWRWYAAYLTDPEWLAATARSFEVALLTTALATALGTSAAFALTRHRFRGSGAVTGLILAPMIVPRMVLAVAMFYTYAHLQLVGTTLGLVLAHTVLAIPYVVVTVCAALKTYDFRLDDAAATLGANRWRTFRYVTLPIIRGGVVSGALFAFITSFDDLNVALFVTGGLFTTLPKKMWDDMLLQVHPTLAVVSTLLVALISIVLIVVESTRARGAAARADA